MLGLEPDKRKNAGIGADYLLANQDYLAFVEAHTGGWPIATGVIEGQFATW